MSILTLGLSVFVIDVIVLWFSSKLVPGFSVTGLHAGIYPAPVLALIQMLLGFLDSKIKRV